MYDHRHPQVAASQARKNGDLDYLLGLLNDTDPEAREAAAYNLGKLKSRGAVAALARCLMAADEGLQLHSLIALANIGDDRVSEEVFEVATGTSSLWVRTTAVSTLVSLGDRRAGAIALGMFDDPDASKARRFSKWALETLITTRETTAIPVLQERARVSSFWERRRIHRAIRILENR